MKNQILGGPGPVKVDLRNIPPMKCFCGCNVFYQVHNLHYISPILANHPTGQTANVFMFECKQCQHLWPNATTADGVNQRFQKLPEQEKQRILALKKELKAKAEQIQKFMEQRQQAEENQK